MSSSETLASAQFGQKFVERSMTLTSLTSLMDDYKSIYCDKINELREQGQQEEKDERERHASQLSNSLEFQENFRRRNSQKFKVHSETLDRLQGEAAALAAEIKQLRVRKSFLAPSTIEQRLCAASEVVKLIQGVNDELSKRPSAPDCALCLSAARNTVFSPCNHCLCCETCAPKLKTCPICRAGILTSIKIHWS